MIIITTNFNDQLTATLSVLCYFVPKESTSVMRQAQWWAGWLATYMYSLCTVVAFAHWNFIVFNLKNSKIQPLYLYAANQFTWEDHDLHCYLFSFADVNTRKNFACINFGVRVDSCT